MTPALRVTEVLRLANIRPPLSVKDAEWYLNRGTQIHAATVLIDKGQLDWEKTHPDLLPYCRAYAKFLDVVRPKVIATEQEVIGNGYVGHLDRVYQIGRKRYVCDIKTNAPDIATRIQTMAYLQAWKGKAGRMAVGLFDTETYQVEWYREEDDAPDLACWQGAWKVAQWKIRNGVKE